MPRSAEPIGKVRILLIEDSPEDAELSILQLQEAGLEAEYRRVDNAAGVAQAMAEFRPDLVLSDLSMPGFSGHEALRMVRQAAPNVPFIFLSGTMGEETAVQALREGAVDYILKDKAARLPAAAARAIREARSLAERERVEKELLRSQRLDCLAMLAAGLSHDLRNILQPLLIVPDMLTMHSDNPKVHKLGEVIAECGRRGHEMAESMLSFVRGSRAARETIEIGALFQAVQLLLQGSLPRQVQLRLEPGPAGLSVDANHTELQQAVLNLCLNALQAMPDGGTLTLSAGIAEEQGRSLVSIRVADTGIGMDEASRAQLFTPFFSTKPDGTGLGLMSCKRIVDSYSGRIEVYSEAGKGSTFEMLFPPLAVDMEEVTEHAAEGWGQRILVVDGDVTRLSLIGNALNSQGYDPIMAQDGAMALRVLEHADPELLIVDSDILLLSAVSLLRAVRDEGYAGPVIALQDIARPLAREDLPGDMRIQVLSKPLEMRRVFQAVQAALHGPALARA